jgi:fructose-1,6-bisphosphatase I
MAAPLTLPGDAPNDATLDAWLSARAVDDRTAALTDIVARIAHAAPALAGRLALAHIPGDPARIVGTNESGDRQKAIDVAAHDHFLAALQDAGIAAIVSEEDPGIIPWTPGAPFALALDPLDGSGSIGVGAQLGTLFAVFPAEAGGAAFRRPGRDAVAAGYLAFGHSTDLGISLGDGVTLATLDPRDGRFRITAERATIAAETAMIACNASYERRWAPGLQTYMAELRAGAAGPRGRDANMRWLAAAVGEMNRILRKGGVFMYPADDRPGHENGLLRLLYEAIPLAFLAEQAGGAASDGTRPILDIVPNRIHQTVPLFFGAAGEVARVVRHLE